MSFDGWLDARDGEALEREWATLGATKVEIGVHPQFPVGIQPAGAALLAAAWLGGSPDRFAWFAEETFDDENLDEDDERPVRPAPSFEIGRTVARSFFDGAVDVREECDEEWVIREVSEGARGLQLIQLGYTIGPMTREGGNGGGAKVLRLFDREARRGVSVELHSNAAFTIGEPIDLTPLDLFGHSVNYKLPWTTIELAAVRGFIAQITADLDAHFDTSTEWEGETTRDEVLESHQYNFRTRRREVVFRSGPYSIELGENLDPDVADPETSMFWVVVRGLPWGHACNVRIAKSSEADAASYPVDGWIVFTLPLAQLEAAVARTAKVPGISI